MRDRAAPPVRDAAGCASLQSWAPHAMALRDFLAGQTDAEVTVRDEAGEVECTPARVFFRGPDEFSALEAAALDLCRGRVLDVGSGAGCHALALQARGLTVVAIDVAPEAVDVMRRRGVRDARRADVFAWDGERFDTVLILMNGIGLVGTLDGLDCFLAKASRLLDADAQILLDSFDPGPPDPARPGRYAGEMRFQLEYAGIRGAFYEFVFLDYATLRRHAVAAGWRCESIWQEAEGHYLARLSLNPRAKSGARG